jgi:hypothetical protein
MKSVIAGKTKKGNDYLSLEMTEQEFSTKIIGHSPTDTN